MTMSPEVQAKWQKWIQRLITKAIGDNNEVIANESVKFVHERMDELRQEHRVAEARLLSRILKLEASLAERRSLPILTDEERHHAPLQ